MNRRHRTIALSLSLMASHSLMNSAPAFAGDFNSSATPRQLAHCVVQRVRANATESYRDAFKACKSEFDSARSDSARSDRPTDTVLTSATLPGNSKP
jgi:hypothetical protein